MAKIILWVTGPIASIIMGVLIQMIIFDDANIDPQLFGNIIGSTIAALVWSLYLSKSKRVKNTYHNFTIETVNTSGTEITTKFNNNDSENESMTGKAAYGNSENLTSSIYKKGTEAANLANNYVNKKAIKLTTNPMGMKVIVNDQHSNDLTPMEFSLQGDEIYIQYYFKEVLIAQKKYNTPFIENNKIFEDFLQKVNELPPEYRDKYHCIRCDFKFQGFYDKCQNCQKDDLVVKIENSRINT